MRWFKHLSNTNETEEMSELLYTFGAEGYGIYWIIREKIASQMDKSRKTSLRLPLKIWKKFFGISTKKLKNFLSFAQKNEIFFVEFSENFITIDCPNLLNNIDNFTKREIKKYEQSTNKVRTNFEVSTHQDKDKDKEKEKNPKKENFFGQTKILKKPKPDSHPRFNEFWELWPLKKAVGQARKTFSKLVMGNEPLVDEILEGLKKNLKELQTESKREKGKFLPHASTWLNAERWKDVPMVEAEVKKSIFVTAETFAVPESKKETNRVAATEALSKIIGNLKTGIGTP